jgi:replication factor A1
VLTLPTPSCAQVKVGDETGCILLTCKNGQSLDSSSHHLFTSFLTSTSPSSLSCSDQIAIVTSGASVTIRNAKIVMFKGQMRLAVDQWGLIEHSEQPFTATVDVINNLSDVEYELVDA